MKPLTGKYARIVYDGEDWSEHYSKKLAARSAVILHALSKDWTFPDCELNLLNSLNPGSDLWFTGDNGRPLARPEPLRRLRRDYDRMAKRQRDYPGYKSATDARAYIGELKREAGLWPWRSRYDRDVLRFFHAQAAWVGCDLVNISTRQASIGAGCSQKAVRNSIPRLIMDGWIERVQDSRATGPADAGLTLLSPRKQQRQPRSPLYKLTLPTGCATETHITSRTVPRESNVSPYCAPPDPGADHECWVQVGKLAMDLYMVLSDKPISGREAARRAGGAAESNTRLTLGKMADQYGLARKTDDGWIRGRCDPDQVVEDQGWVGSYSKRTARALQYANDRDNFKYLGRDGALNDRRVKEAARAPVRLKEARAKTAGPSDPVPAPVTVPEPNPLPKCSRDDCNDYDNGRGLCFSHELEQEAADREAERVKRDHGKHSKQWNFKELPEAKAAASW